MSDAEGRIKIDDIKSAGDVRKVFSDVMSEVQTWGQKTDDHTEQMVKMRADLETAMEAQKKLTEAGRPQPSGFGHIKTPTWADSPRKMVTWASRLNPVDYDGQAGQSIKRFQDCADVAALQHNVAKHIVAKGGSEEREWYKEKILSGEVMQEYSAAAENLFAKQNINTENAGEGLEWVPDEIKSSQFIDRIRDASFYAGLYVQITMAGKTFTLPANGGDIGVFLVPELTGGLPASPATGEDIMGSREVIFAASKMGVRTGWSRESTEDMTIQTGSIITQNMAQRMADQIDSNILFGDTDASFHTLTPAGNVAGGAARMWDGIVKACSVANRDADGLGATLGWQLMGDQLGRMGQAAGSRFSMSNTGANGAIYHVTWKSFFDLVKEQDATTKIISPIVTLDKYGPAATIIDGEAARIFGRPIIPTEFMRDDLLAASGAWALTGDTAACVCSNVGQWGVGTRRGMELRVSTELYMESDAIVAVTFYRGDFQPLQTLSASGIGDLLYNIV